MTNDPITISLNQIGRRFNRDWIFKGVDYAFETGSSYAVLGPNGSGKSTLLQILNASLSPSAGAITFTRNSEAIEPDLIYRYLSLAAPYLEVIEDFTLAEMIDFHFKFKNYLPGLDKDKVLEILGLQAAKNKLIKYFSSGMKQRLKLALAFCADTTMLMLDEPTSNLDTQGVEWYLELIERFTHGRMLIICSNQQHEYSFCKHQLHITDYKNK